MRRAKVTIRAGTRADTRAHAARREENSYEMLSWGKAEQARGLGLRMTVGGVCVIMRARKHNVLISTTLGLTAGSCAAYGRHFIRRVDLEEKPR